MNTLRYSACSKRLRPLFLVVVLAAILLTANNALQAEDWVPLWTIANLSEGRSYLSATSAGGKVFFGGGYEGLGDYLDVVDIYDSATDTWSTTNLSVARGDLSATSAGGKVFFGGGYDGSSYSDVVDIYHTAMGTWSTTNLSQKRMYLSAASAGGKVFFGGGVSSSGYSDVVDIYDTAMDTWSTANLSQGRCSLSATSSGGKVFFGGGSGSSGYSDVVDIYDTATDTWSTANLSVARESLSATSAGGKVFFGGGGGYSGSGFFSDVVDIYDTATDTWSTANLSQARCYLSATSTMGKVFFAGGYSGSGIYNDAVDIYDTATDTWSTTNLSQARCDLSATSVVNQAFFGGGTPSLSSVVDIYSVQNYGTITSSQVWALVDQTTVAGRMQLNSPGSLELATFNLDAGSMSGDAPIDLGTGTLTVGADDSPSTTYSGVISGSGSLVKTGSGTLVLTGSSYVGGMTITASDGTLEIGDANSYTGFSTDGTLEITAPTARMVLHSKGFIDLGPLTSLEGGTLAAPNGVSLGIGDNVVLSGSVEAKIAAGYASIIDADDTLTIGDTNAYDGFTSDGVLYVNDNTVTINDKNEAVLGSLTEIGYGRLAGTLAAPNGLLVEFGKNIVGYGTVDTPNDAAKPLMNNGTIVGNSGSEQITLNGYVKGVGTFSDVVFAGTYSPGLSPADVMVSDIAFTDASTLNMELGGMNPGSEYDVLHATGSIDLDGTLEMSLINGFTPSIGNTFTIMTFDSVSGEFDTYQNMLLGNGLFLEPTFTPSTMVLIVKHAIDGDANVDGTVDVSDLGILATNYGTGGGHVWEQADFNGDGFVDVSDLGILATNYGSGTVDQSVPEPSTFVGLLPLCLVGLSALARRKC
ncbi:MAG: autotransporter-associated beta strand repeat-containing protein [Pirellulales bacterium]|nr:autotransporter-associated beta strand repeat-containing protein [Pirellulales bacterium]